MKRLIAMTLLAMFSVGFLAACNTMDGLGKDMEKVGEEIQDEADDSGATEP